MKSIIDFLVYYIPFQLYRWNKKERFQTFAQIVAIMFFQYGLAIYVYLTDYSGIHIDSMIYNPDRRKNPMSVLIAIALFIPPVLFYYFNKQKLKNHYLRFINEPKEIQLKKKKWIHVFIWIITPIICFMELVLLNYLFD